MAVARTPVESKRAKLELPVAVAVSQVKPFPPCILQPPRVFDMLQLIGGKT